MNGYLLDTNVLSELIRKSPAPQLLERMRSVPAYLLATSAICVMELRHGATRRGDGGVLWNRIVKEILPRVRIVPFGSLEAIRAGDLLAELGRLGKPLELEDVQIAATAFEREMVAVTQNRRHFDRFSGLVVESWWE